MSPPSPTRIPQEPAARMRAFWLQVLDLGVPGNLAPQPAPARTERPREVSRFVSLP